MQQKISVKGSKATVWLIGNSMLIDGVEACLRDLKMDNLVRWNVINADFAKNLKASHPELIIFEQGTPEVDKLLNMIQEYPGINMLGIDLESNKVLIMDSFQIQIRSMSDLHRVVQDIAGGRE